MSRPQRSTRARTATCVAGVLARWVARRAFRRASATSPSSSTLASNRRATVGQKVHPTGFRLGIIKTWTSKWYEDKAYAKWLHEDIRIKRAIKDYLFNANIAGIEVE